MAELTHLQHALWFTEEAGIARTAYHMPLGIWFHGDLHLGAIEDACRAVIARHALLGCAVGDPDGGSPALAPAEGGLVLSFGELTEQRVSDEIARPFNLRSGPLARFALLREAPDRHLLLITAHHLVFDGMSKDILVGDLATAYSAAVAGRSVDLGPVTGFDPDLATAAPADAQQYWDPRWSEPTDVVLPGLSRIPTGAEAGSTVQLVLEGALTDRLAWAAREIGVTQFELLLTAIGTLLERYGNPAMPIAVGLSTRTPATAGQVGLFVNELPIVVPPGTGSVRDHARATRTRLRELYRFRSVPISHLSGALRPTTAIAPISVGYRRRGPDPVFAGVSSTVEWTWFGGSARNALHIQALDSPTGLTIGLQHSTAAIPTDAVERIAGHLRTLLAAMGADPDRPVDALPILPAPELDLVLGSGNRTARSYPDDATVVTLFADRVRDQPDAVAVAEAGRPMTYRQLDISSRRLAASLRAFGVEPGALVGVSMPRSGRAIVALLAVLRAGAAYVPIDPTYPAARRALIVADARPAVIVGTATSLADLDPSLGIAMLDLDRIDLNGESGDASGAPPELGGDRSTVDGTAYVMYTSGSTGRPKGVEVTHRSLTNLLCAMAGILASRPADRWLSLTSLSFDISIVELFLPLITGGCVVAAPELHAADGPGIVRYIAEYGITHVQATPSTWRILVHNGLAADPSVRRVVAITGGEPLPPALARELRARVARLFNGYGPTETTVYSTVAEIPPEVDVVTIGEPIANTQAYVLDSRRRPVPVGVPGELYLGGHGLAKGYLRQSELTDQRFADHVFGPVQARLYRTGDLCRWLPDGRLAHIGRADDQVKVRGHRVELGEIEARLLEHPTVAAAAAALRGSEEARLVGYVVARGGAVVDAAILRRHLAELLPAAMVPEDWMTLPRLPVTPNGKLDRNALPEPAQQRAVGSEPSRQEPDEDPGGVVARIRTIWQEVLRVDAIALDEDLFDLGGHSLSITRINGRIQQQLGVLVPLDAFFDTPTLGEIADLVLKMRGVDA